MFYHFDPYFWELSKTLNCLVVHSIDKHKIYWVKKYKAPQTFADIDYMLNYVRVKLLQAL